MQKVATQLFIISSLIFGVLGIILVFVQPDGNINESVIKQILTKSFMTSIFVILPSFALSVAGKYLQDRK